MTASVSRQTPAKLGERGRDSQVEEKGRDGQGRGSAIPSGGLGSAPQRAPRAGPRFSGSLRQVPGHAPCQAEHRVCLAGVQDSPLWEKPACFLTQPRGGQGCGCGTGLGAWPLREAPGRAGPVVPRSAPGPLGKSLHLPLRHRPGTV